MPLPQAAALAGPLQASCAAPPATGSHDGLLAFLREPATHAAPGQALPQVEVIETHMSWVFLAGDRVLKLKKPVRYPFLDFSTPAAREACCRAEVRLNLRLAPGVYRGLLAVLWQDGGYRLVPDAQVDRHSPVVDWLVCMTRLPCQRMLDHLIVHGTVQPHEVDALAELMGTFYRGAVQVTLDPDEHLARLQREQAVTREVLLRPQFALDGAAQALDRLDEALHRHRASLHRRAADGRIVDGHGDLRPEHVCLLQPPVVIDCLEFNSALRQVDPFDELAFLALECEMAGAGWIGQRLIHGCEAALGDTPPPALMQLYTASRALLRARLSMAHLLDLQPRTPGRWAPQAQRYVGRARAALDALEFGDRSFSATTRRDFRG